MRHHTHARAPTSLPCLPAAVLVAVWHRGRRRRSTRARLSGAPPPLPRIAAAGSSDVGVDGPRLVAACTALETRAAALVPDIGANGAHDAVRFVGRHCEWRGSGGSALVVGMIDDSGAASDLDETVLFYRSRTLDCEGRCTRGLRPRHPGALRRHRRPALVRAARGLTAAADPSALKLLVALGRDLVGIPATR